MTSALSGMLMEPAQKAWSAGIVEGGIDVEFFAIVSTPGETDVGKDRGEQDADSLPDSDDAISVEITAGVSHAHDELSVIGPVITR